MRERPIIFSGPMVRAILDGRKTMTRRVIKPQPYDEYKTVMGIPLLSWRGCKGWDRERMITLCNYGVPGDLLWVRETWREGRLNTDAPIYREASERNIISTNCKLVKWRPSIYMPRRASRITLEVTDVRVERVQEITCADAIAEGTLTPAHSQVYRKHTMNHDSFSDLWDSLNAKRGYGWDVNPWVWVISFKRIKP